MNPLLFSPFPSLPYSSPPLSFLLFFHSTTFLPTLPLILLFPNSLKTSLYLFSAQYLSDLPPPPPLPLSPSPPLFSLSHSLTTSFVKMKTKSSLPKYFYSCSLTKQGAETMQKDVQAYLSRQQKDGKLSPDGLFTVIWKLSSLTHCPV